MLGILLFSSLVGASPSARRPFVSFDTSECKPNSPTPLPKIIEIAGITVTGSQFYDGNSMINISGLQVGDKIKVPGDMIASAIRKIMDQGILEEVEIYATKTEGEKIWLNIALKERPRLYALQYIGVRKGEIETLNEKVKAYKGKIITETLRKNLELAIRKFYQEKGRLNVKTKSIVKTDTIRGNNATLTVQVDKGGKGQSPSNCPQWH
jgi:outer membrane protein insertion porin family